MHPVTSRPTDVASGPMWHLTTHRLASHVGWAVGPADAPTGVMGARLLQPPLRHRLPYVGQHLGRMPAGLDPFVRQYHRAVT